MEETGQDKKIEQFEQELQLQRRKPAGGDNRISAYCLASLDCLAEESSYGTLIESVMYEREFLAPSHAVNIALRALQKQLLRGNLRGHAAGDRDYPYDYNSVEPWAEALRAVSEPSSVAYEEFFDDVTKRNVQSNVSERYKAVKLTALAMEPRVGKNPSTLDIGSCRLHGLKKLGSGVYFPFRDVGAEELIRNEAGDIIGTSNDHKSEQLLNSMLAKEFSLGESVGLDVVPIDDEQAKEWAKSCSFYPSEFLDAERVEEYDALELIEPENLSFYQADFSNIDLVHFRRDTGIEAYDIVTFSSVLYQVTSSQVEVMLENAKEVLKPGGVILLQDFVGVDKNDPTKLEFFNDWFKQPYIYRTILFDPAVNGDRLANVFRWDNGRCNTILSDVRAGRSAAIDVQSLERYAVASAAKLRTHE